MRTRRTLLVGVVGGVVLLMLATVISQTLTPRSTGANPPIPWLGGSIGWEVDVHSEDPGTWKVLEPMAAGHGGGCEAPPMTHAITTYEDSVFDCNNHVMTSMNAGGYGLIYMTPPTQADWSAADAKISFNMSTMSTSGRDWPDVWVTPFADNLSLPLDNWLPDGNGEPRNTIHVRLQNRTPQLLVTRNDVTTTVEDTQWWVGWDQILTPSATLRTRFELTVARTHLRFCAVGLNPNDPANRDHVTSFCWLDANVPDLGFTSGVVQFGHHSYNPTKDEGNCPCLPNTWHWDPANVVISPSRPMTIDKADRRYIDPTSPSPVTLAAPAPAGSFLRFAAIGSNVQVSFDGGAWQNATRAHYVKPPTGERFDSYWMPMPAGTRTVGIRASSWFGGDWFATSIAAWSQSGLSAPPPPTLSPTPSSAPTPTAPPASPTPAPTASPTQAPTTQPTPTPTTVATPTPAATATPAATPMATVINFDARATGGLNGSYGGINWGTNRWFLSGPWGHFTTNSISFPSGTPRSATFSFTTPRVLVSLEAFNGGGSASTVTLSCAGNPTATHIVPQGQKVSIATGWVRACGVVTVGSSNSWETNFDNIAYR